MQSRTNKSNDLQTHEIKNKYAVNKMTLFLIFL